MITLTGAPVQTPFVKDGPVLKTGGWLQFFSNLSSVIVGTWGRQSYASTPSAGAPMPTSFSVQYYGSGAMISVRFAGGGSLTGRLSLPRECEACGLVVLDESGPIGTATTEGKDLILPTITATGDTFISGFVFFTGGA